MKLIVGLGNPGRAYTNNRHNVGFACLNYFARWVGIRFDNRESLARTGTGDVGDNKIVLARPQTFMNLSGRSVSRMVKKFNLSPDDLIVIHDEIDLPLDRIQIRGGLSSAGHKGVSSIINELGSQNFIRIRIGIGQPTLTSDATETSEADVATYVLSDFTPEERKIINKAIPRASEAIYCLITEGLTAAMNKYN